ncbi:MAG: hypothetical protein KatS3mg085_115 [Candidatus Dojkabacteria bacterium]|nr:MAG: hypothetical protein KatS3mg085_115 [Candidatus Dojkabacteria bacterium]
MKKLILIFCLLVFVKFSAQLALAQVNMENNDTVETATSSDFTAKLLQLTQEPSSKKAVFVMQIKSGIKSDRVLINWEVKGGSQITDTYSSKGLLIVEPGKTYNVPIEIKPFPNSVTEVYGVAEAFLIDGKKIATVRKNFSTNNNAEILPLTDEYLQAKRDYQIKQAVTSFLVFVIAIALSYFGIKKFIAYLKRDDVAVYDQKLKDKK